MYSLKSALFVTKPKTKTALLHKEKNFLSLGYIYNSNS